MRKQLLILSALALTLVLSACTSQPRATIQAVGTPCPVTPAPPAALMQPGPDLLTPLNGIISPSGSGSAQQTSK